MEQKETLNNLLNLIKESNNLSREDKIKFEFLLGKMERNSKSYDLAQIIEYLEELIKDLGDPKLFTDQEYLAPRYKDLLYQILDKIKLEKRKVDIIDDEFIVAFDDYRPITLEKILSSFCKIEKDGDKIILTPKDKDLLSRNVNIYQDDGMGYSPGGYNSVFSAYQDKDDNISMWI